jgi:hypothetical protein
MCSLLSAGEEMLIKLSVNDASQYYFAFPTADIDAWSDGNYQESLW